MSGGIDLIWTVVISTLVMACFIGFVTLLLILNSNNRARHRAELAEAEQRRAEELVRVEREAVQATLVDVGRELHDNVAQLLSVAQLGLNSTLLGIAAPGTLEAARDALDQGVEEVRRLGHSLNSDLWVQRSLADAIRVEAERIERVGRVRANVLLSGALPTLDGDTSTILFRVFQEVVHNALKHSAADTLTIHLRAGPPFTLTIADNGRGFDLGRTAGRGGLANIPRRCALIGFTATCATAPAQGCTWTLTQNSAQRSAQHGPLAAS